MPVIEPDKIPADLLPVIEALCATGIDVAATIARGPLGQSLGAGVGENTGGDQQKALDVMADEAFEKALGPAGVKYYASEEQESVLTLGGEKFALAIDPLDGSSNIDVNVSIGTIFSVFPAGAGPEESFLRPASEQIAAGYIIFGPQCGLVVTFGSGTLMYVLDPADTCFKLVETGLSIPASAKEYAINAGYRRHWPDYVRSYVEQAEAGKDGPRGKDFGFRWVASLVAETHRILSRGGVFLYTGDARPAYARGRLRMVYEVAPMAFLVEQAGGKATNGKDPILSLSATELHQKIPFVFGAAEEVDHVAGLHG
ncbi:class 1 fructose-bisphosphatase [Pseudooceanicola sp. 216_PA32_1]|uniref:Fructose-1,6-bisphosphatase class 1 n=1 Tax=Pseudooceanicola pacificus TaxID=2676438 RepID=A0A844W4V3_9RHOB|nr:class 1 fructose-bisphosphatase [Pseudooceanicola pacificus]MWB79286.1 class 1 fructose-bisphosphatase [Pseudooceanicola pacificus]